MSEYQFYEFLAIDRPLTRMQIAEVQRFSTRATITATSFVNEYHWGDFRGDPKEFLEKYFDAMVYFANWGSRQFMFRLPRHLADLNRLKTYCTNTSLNVTPVGEYVLVDMNRAWDDPSDDFGEGGGGYMSSLAGLRAELISGDMRPVFLAWLAELEIEGIEKDAAAPPVPPGLRNLTASQRSLVDFLEIDDALIDFAARESASISAPAELDIDSALSRISMSDKDKWLKELIESDDPHAGMRIKLKLQAAVLPKMPEIQESTRPTAGEFYARYRKYADDLEEQRRNAFQSQKRTLEAQMAAKRGKQLDDLLKNVAGAWRNLDQMIGLKNAEGYKQAVQSMVDLREASNRPGGDPAAFRRELATRLAEHSRKPQFMKQVRLAGLM